MNATQTKDTLILYNCTYFECNPYVWDYALGNLQILGDNMDVDYSTIIFYVLRFN